MQCQKQINWKLIVYCLVILSTFKANCLLKGFVSVLGLYELQFLNGIVMSFENKFQNWESVVGFFVLIGGLGLNYSLRLLQIA